jgi:uncharacterized protein YybS (DUF2232 family)
LAGTLSAAGFFLFSMFFPVLGILVVIFTSLPILYVRVKRGRIAAVIVFGVSSLIVYMLLSRLSSEKGLPFFIELAFTGLIMGEFWEKGLDIDRTVAYSVCAAIGTSFILILLSGFIAQQPPLELLRSDLLQNLEYSAELYRSLGVHIENEGDLKVFAEKMVTLLFKLLPSLMVLGFSVLVWSNLVIFRRIANLQKLMVPGWGELNRWQAPERLVWGFVASGFATMMPATVLKWAGINGLIIFALLYFSQGLAIISFLFEKKRTPRVVRIVIYVVICIQQVFSIMVAVLGLLDVWFDFRKLHNRADAST